MALVEWLVSMFVFGIKIMLDLSQIRTCLNRNLA